MAVSLQGLTARQIGRQIREALRCTTCGKSIVVLNTAGYRQQFVGEAVTVDSHCFCAGSPMRTLYPQVTHEHIGPGLNEHDEAYAPDSPPAPLCTTCNGYGEIDDPHHPGGDADPFTPPTIPCPDPRCPGAVR